MYAFENIASKNKSTGQTEWICDVGKGTSAGPLTHTSQNSSHALLPTMQTCFGSVMLCDIQTEHIRHFLHCKSRDAPRTSLLDEGFSD